MEELMLGIYGAGGLGREVLELARQINDKDHKWDKFFFIDDNPAINHKVINDAEVFTYDEALNSFGGKFECALGIGEPATREKVISKLLNNGIEIPTLIYPGTYIPSTTKIGKGVTIQYGCFISCNITIQDYVFLQPHCNIGHDDFLDEGCMISGFGNLGGEVKIGKYAFVGLGAAIEQGRSVGDFSIVSMGAVVYKSVDDAMIVMGNPARPIRKNDEKRVFK